MIHGLLQDWVTIDGTSMNAVMQSHAAWQDLAPSGDITLWLEVRAVTWPGGGDVLLTYETAPCRDESLFQPLGIVNVSPSATPLVSKFRLVDGSVPVGRFLRWKLQGTALGAWSVTFRIFFSAGRAATLLPDPGGFNLSGWWRDYAASTWSGTASAGQSGNSSQDLLDSASRPPIGQALNGHNSADFDGSSQYLTSNGNVLAYFSTTAYSAAVLFNADTAATAAVNVYDDPAILTDTGPTWSMNFSDAGFGAAHYASGWHTHRVSCSTGTYHLGQVKFDGSSVKMRIDDRDWVSFSAGALETSSAYTLRAARNYNNVYFDGRVIEIITADVELSDDDFDRLRVYMNQRYSVSV